MRTTEHSFQEEPGRNGNGNPGNGKPGDLLARLMTSGGLPPLDQAFPVSETAPQRWQRLFSDGIAIKEAFNLPYIQAVAPAFAAAVLAVGKEKVELLVIGGGDGHFSRMVLPEVLMLLSTRPKPIEVNVLETDLTDNIMRAPARAAVVDARELDRHYMAGSFDVVVGEAMLHQGGPNGVAKTIQQAAHVLSKSGVFVHVQDAIPDPRDWVSPTRLSDLGIAGIPIMRADSDKHRVELVQVSREAHAALAQCIHRETKALGGAFMLGAVQGDKTVTELKLPPHLFTRRLNAVAYDNGTLGQSEDPTLPDGRIKLTYRGTVSFIRPHQQLKTLLDAIDVMCSNES